MKTATMVRSAFVVLLAALYPAPARAGEPIETAAELPPYQQAGQVSGEIKSVGSDSMKNLMALWAETFERIYPGVTVEIEAKGSSTAPPALVAGTANLGLMSRSMKSKEIDAFEKRFGYKPIMVRTAIDVLAIYVHKDNPIVESGLTLPQIDAIFSKTRKGGCGVDVTTWGQVGLSGRWADKPINLYGRNGASGTHGFFKMHALFKGDFRDTVREKAGSALVLQAVASDLYGIGYSGIGFRNVGVGVVPIAIDAQAGFVSPSAATVNEYPLARYLTIYLNKRPGESLDPQRREFLKLVFSKEGQAAVIKDGYLPITTPIATSDLKKVGLALDVAKPGV